MELMPGTINPVQSTQVRSGYCGAKQTHSTSQSPYDMYVYVHTLLLLLAVSRAPVLQQETSQGAKS